MMLDDKKLYRINISKEYVYGATTPSGPGYPHFKASRSHWHVTQDYSVRMISPTRRPIPDNTQHSQQADVHASSGIRTRNPGKRKTADPRLADRTTTGIGCSNGYMNNKSVPPISPNLWKRKARTKYSTTAIIIIIIISLTVSKWRSWRCFKSKTEFRNIYKANHLGVKFLQRQATHWGRNRWQRIPAASSNRLQTSIANSTHLTPACLLALVFYCRKENSITMTTCLALQVTATADIQFTFEFLDIFLTYLLHGAESFLRS